ncbi:MAG TPA: hypothetical protein DHW54_07410 [Gemmatimonadetes bacterium]|nr:hypothetical protein [Gemmatimonadota bacterium]
MNYRKPTLLLALIALGACEQPTAPVVKDVELLSDAAIASFAEQISESSAVKLPSLDGLLRASRKAIRASDGANKQAIRHFRAAHRFASAAEDSTEAGNEDAAKKLRHRSYGHRLRGVVAALGTEAVAGAVAGSEAGLTRLQDRLNGREISEGAAKRLGRIVELMDRAQTMLASDKPVQALHIALTTADGIRHFSPRYVARKQIGRARDVIKQAIAAVGDTPTEEEAKSIKRARKLLGAANEAFDSRQYNRARSTAQRSARLSWGVVNGRAG